MKRTRSFEREILFSERIFGFANERKRKKETVRSREFVQKRSSSIKRFIKLSLKFNATRTLVERENMRF